MLQHPQLIHFVALLEHVDIFPVELKLDYKPKRVDYRALKEGKTIELMNFFHFDGSEMTLRHIEMFGVRHFHSHPHTSCTPFTY